MPGRSGLLDEILPAGSRRWHLRLLRRAGLGPVCVDGLDGEGVPGVWYAREGGGSDAKEAMQTFLHHTHTPSASA